MRGFWEKPLQRVFDYHQIFCPIIISCSLRLKERKQRTTTLRVCLGPLPQILRMHNVKFTPSSTWNSTRGVCVCPYSPNYDIAHAQYLGGVQAPHRGWWCAA